MAENKKAKSAFNKLVLGKSGGHGVKTKGVTTKGPQGPNPSKAPTLTHGKGTRATVKGVTVKAGKHMNKTGHMSHGKGGK